MKTYTADKYFTKLTHFAFHWKIILFLASNLVILSACKKDKNDTPPMPEKIKLPEGTLQADTGNAIWKGKTASAVINEGTISIKSINQDGDTLFLKLQGDQTGKYLFNTASENIATYIERDGNRTYSSYGIQDGIGSVEITVIDTNFLLLTGDFSLFLTSADGNKKTFKNGHFYKIPYTYSSAEEETNMEGSINGKPFKAFARGNKDYFIGSSIAILGLSRDTLTISLFIKKSDQAGTYLFPEDGIAAVTLKSKYYSDGTGTITISKVDEVAKTFTGTFEFTAVNKNNYDTLKVRNGSFKDVKFP
ncbi:MAG TPA: DUF6252 family protein [Cytophagaceae bacterium]|jgi:hypothetical protein